MDCMKDGFVRDLLLEGRYKTISPLNHGSFGMVFLAKDLKENQLVAIKCLAKPSIASPCPDVNTTDHLLELMCHERLGRHPNIVNLLHAFETPTHMFLVLEYCPQGDLYEAIRQDRGPVQTDNVRGFMRQLIDAVEFMHAKGLYHRDVKPENLFLAADGTLKLGDFGLSTTETWTTEACVGSDRYMAPEQYDPGEVGYSPAQADAWAIGICLLNVLFARNPFVTPTESDVLFADFVRNRQSLFDVFPALSQDAFEVLTHSLSIDPEKRSLSGMRKALERVISFTTEDDVSDDDFCTDATRKRPAVPAATTASRAPLRTPSIQSPPVEQGGAFPWAKALHLTSPLQPTTRQLSAIPDTEPAPEAQASSFASGIDSALGASIQSIQLREPKPRVSATATATSVPPMPVPSPAKPATASLYATDNVSKSWSDLWDEESEAEEDARRAYSNLNWSSDALNEDHGGDVTEKPAGIPAPAPALSTSPKPLRLRAAASSSDLSSPSTPSPKSPAYAPPAKRGVLDWAALGNRRRAAHAEPASPALEKTEVTALSSSTPVESPAKPSNTHFGGSTWRRGFGGLKAFTGNVGLRRQHQDTAASPSLANLTAVAGNGRISNASLTDLPATPGSVGLGLQAEPRSEQPRSLKGASAGTPRSTGRMNLPARRAVEVDDWRKDSPVTPRSPFFFREHQQPPQPAGERKRRMRTRTGGSVALRGEHHTMAPPRRDEVEWVGGWKDLQL